LRRGLEDSGFALFGVEVAAAACRGRALV
jgi:hypothetical protein